MISDLSAFYYNKGLAHAKLYNISAAVTCLKKSVLLGPDNGNAWGLLGLCYYKMGRLPMARHCWCEAINNPAGENAERYLKSLEMDLPHGEDSLGKSIKSARLGDFSASLRYLRESGILSVESSQLYSYSGIIKYLCGKGKQSKADWIHAMEFDKSDLRPLLYMANMDTGLNRFIKKLKSAIAGKFAERHDN